MSTTAAAVLGGLLGLLIGVAGLVAVELTDRARRARGGEDHSPLADGVADVLAVLSSSALVLDGADAVAKSSPAAATHGLVRDGELAHSELLELARQVRRDGVIRELEVDLRRGPIGSGRIPVRARVAPLGSAHVLVLVDDLTQARRVEEIRRDFVANVSHELKTPVGGLSLLAEAVLDASDDPEAVERFAKRMKIESSRLTRLVQEIVDLSRLQAADTLHEPEVVDLSIVAQDAIEGVRLVAEAKQIALTSVSAPEDPGTPGAPSVYGDRELLLTAVSNLLSNAVSYSGQGTRVAVAVRRTDGLVEVSVTDQGQGIPDAEQARIFERFYRVDAARSRATGGTGLGLAIVKHVCSNHGGEVTVWSQEGRGSTFTMRLPAVAADSTTLVEPAPAVPQLTTTARSWAADQRIGEPHT